MNEPESEHSLEVAYFLDRRQKAKLTVGDMRKELVAKGYSAEQATVIIREVDRIEVSKIEASQRKLRNITSLVTGVTMIGFASFWILFVDTQSQGFIMIWPYILLAVGLGLTLRAVIALKTKTEVENPEPVGMFRWPSFSEGTVTNSCALILLYRAKSRSTPSLPATS